MPHPPVELDAYHVICDDAMRRVVAQSQERVELAKKALSWLIFATRQLTVSELQEALAIEAGDSKIDPDSRPKTADIISACCGLAVLYDEST